MQRCDHSKKATALLNDHRFKGNVADCRANRGTSNVGSAIESKAPPGGWGLVSNPSDQGFSVRLFCSGCD